MTEPQPLLDDQPDRERIQSRPQPLTPSPPPPPGGVRELIALSLPLILGASFWTVQITIDRVFLAAAGADATAATTPAVMFFWTFMALLNNTVLYATVFVAQYTGAGRPGRVGPVIWQALYFAAAAGVLFPLLRPLADATFGQFDHPPAVRELESAYFAALSWAALPILLLSATQGFFAGRQDSWTVLKINAVGAGANALLAVPLIWGHSDDPLRAITGAGTAAALGTTAAAVYGLWLLFGPRYRAEFGTLSGWRFDPALFARLLRFGLPNGVQWCVEGLAWLTFILVVGQIGRDELAATNLTMSLNLLTFLPVAGLGQGVEVLVGRRQGEGRPDVSARTARAGLILATGYMLFVAALYCLIPGVLVYPFAAELPPAEWAAVGPLVPVLLRYVAAYSVADGVNIVLSYALRGAGDTRFVTLVAVGLSWPLMVVPTWLVYRNGWGVEAAWAFATLYIAVMAGVFVARFRGGKWRTMTVIEPAAAVRLDTDAGG